MLAIRSTDLSRVQRAVLASYQRALASRGVTVALHEAEAPGPHLVAEVGHARSGSTGDVYWDLGDRTSLPSGGSGFKWVWHAGPDREWLGQDARIVLLPRNDLFEIRGIDNTAAGWRAYRQLIDIPWVEKLDRVYFCGHATGSWRGPANYRFLACSRVRRHYSGARADVGLLPTFMPRRVKPLAWMRRILRREPEPLSQLARHKFLLSLWGNHPFNPRLHRGLEAGSLVFHQATPSVRLLEDGLLVPGEHYIEVKADLSDLLDQLDYYWVHPNEARAVARAGQARWAETLSTAEPYVVPEVIWERWTSQAGWQASCDYLNRPGPS